MGCARNEYRDALLLVIPVVVYAYDVLDSWIGDPASYDRVIAAVESGKRG